MDIPKGIVKKAARYMRLKKETDKLFEELEWFAGELGFEDFYISDFGITKEPKGEKQSSGAYLDQHMRGEDCGCGVYYFPISGHKQQYFFVAYEF